MLRVQFGSGPNEYDGFVNTDLTHSDRSLRVDVRKTLPYDDGSVDFVLAEHLIEHLDMRQALQFINECYRVIRTDGVVRLSFPDITRIPLSEQVYQKYLRELDDTELSPNQSDSLRVLLGFGHRSSWTGQSMQWVLLASGFKKTKATVAGHSLSRKDVKSIDRHVFTCYEAALETSIVEAVK